MGHTSPSLARHQPGIAKNRDEIHPGKPRKWFLKSPAGDSGFHQGSYLQVAWRGKKSAEVGEVFLGEGNLGYVVRPVRAPFRTPIDHDLLIVILIFGNRDFCSGIAKSACSRKSPASATLGTAILDEMSFPNQDFLETQIPEI
jgi:hypothetical protein